MKVRRNVASVPARSAQQTWAAIADLVTGAGSVDREQLERASSIMESIIADELPARVPIVFKGAGTRVLIYCLYGEEAMEAGLAIDPLPSNPTAGDWRATAPAEGGDVAWINSSLGQRAPRIAMHDVRQAPADADLAYSGQASETFSIDWGALHTT